MLLLELNRRRFTIRQHTLILPRNKGGCNDKLYRCKRLEAVGPIVTNRLQRSKNPSSDQHDALNTQSAAWLKNHAAD